MVLAAEIIEGLRGGYFSRIVVDKAIPGRNHLHDKIADYGFPREQIEAA